MVTLSLTRLAAAVAGLALSLTVGAGVASADPDLGPIVNTTCSYPQVMAALNAQDPAAAAQINSSSRAQSGLQRFLAAPPSERLEMVQQVQSSPMAQQYFGKYVGLVQQVAATCNNY
jgi:hemophore-related protein